MNTNVTSPRRLAITICTILASLVSGCSTPPTEAQLIARQKDRSIYDFLKQDPRIKYSQDSAGNTVTYQSDSYMQTGEYRQFREGLTNFSTNCIANGGKFDIEKKGKNNLGNAVSGAYSASWNDAVSTYDFWQSLGINGTTQAMQVYQQSASMRVQMAQQMAFIFDSAVRTQNVGTFSCTDETTAAVKWRINRDLNNVRKGYRSPSGMYNFPEAYTVTVTETVVAYEKQSYKKAESGYSKLPDSSNGIIYPTSGYYVIIEPVNGTWRTLSSTHFKSPAGNNISTLSLSPKRTNENQEILIISDDGNFVIPAYKDKEVRFAISDSDFSRNRCHVDRIADRMNYSVCNSAFGDTPKEYGTTANVLGTIFGNDPNVAYNMKFTKTIGFVPDKFWAALNQADVRAAISK